MRAIFTFQVGNPDWKINWYICCPCKEVEKYTFLKSKKRENLLSSYPVISGDKKKQKSKNTYNI